MTKENTFDHSSGDFQKINRTKESEIVQATTKTIFTTLAAILLLMKDEDGERTMNVDVEHFSKIIFELLLMFIFSRISRSVIIISRRYNLVKQLRKTILVSSVDAFMHKIGEGDFLARMSRCRTL